MATPLWVSGWPKVLSITNTTASMAFEATVVSGNSASGYFVIIPQDDVAPSDTQIKAGTDSTDTPVAAGFSGNVSMPDDSTEYTVGASNLVNNTSYNAYFVVNSSSDYSTVEMVNFSTLKTTTTTTTTSTTTTTTTTVEPTTTTTSAPTTTPAPEPPVSFGSRAWDRSKPDFRTAHGSSNVKNMFTNPRDDERVGEQESLNN